MHKKENNMACHVIPVNIRSMEDIRQIMVGPGGVLSFDQHI